MAPQAKRLLLLSIDGLSRDNFQLLSQQLVLSNRHLRFDQLVEIDSTPLTSAHAIWAEILTGKSWHENGCIGHARPRSSLKQLEVVTEDHLGSPIRFEVDNELCIYINVPLIARSKNNRIWLAEGSSPSLLRVSPAQLQKQAPYSAYKPRPYSGLATALTSPSKSAELCLALESQRLTCAMQLIESTNWRRCILRLSAFDQLGHLFGPDYLKETTLRIVPSLQKFVTDFDTALAQILKMPDIDVFLLSSFSVIHCIAQININELLIQGGFAQARPANDDDASTLRRSAAALAIAGANIPAAKEGSSPSPSSAASSRGNAAYSPVSGSVYMNAKDRFSDGYVPPEKLARLSDRLKSYLADETRCRYGVDLQMVNLPSVASASLALPDFIIHAEGCEFTDQPAATFLSHGVPKGVHGCRGFVMPAAVAKSGKSLQEIKPKDLLAKVTNQ
jgi:hypothetical protein